MCIQAWTLLSTYHLNAFSVGCVQVACCRQQWSRLDGGCTDDAFDMIACHLQEFNFHIIRRHALRSSIHSILIRDSSHKSNIFILSAGGGRKSVCCNKELIADTILLEVFIPQEISGTNL
ncbi:unnamed protein product [Albugo candida]|uniref:Uncharacterized protein n=1 Tax=Albugo candida TaxID=65357 RepID=A0A024GFT6_9STRA|nr:unnamed protein product [Albugo candida]|eukprot:CCI45557.1 unnamed protein product [Albugo candida]